MYVSCMRVFVCSVLASSLHVGNGPDLDSMHACDRRCRHLGSNPTARRGDKVSPSFTGPKRSVFFWKV